jgi:predicted homoserine dehydrogenase-like protein
MAVVSAAVRDRVCFLGPDAGIQTNVFTYAKRDLPTGATLDGIGGYDCYGMVENVKSDTLLSGLPIALSEGVMLNRSVVRDQPITISDITCNPDRVDFRLYSQALAIRAIA